MLAHITKLLLCADVCEDDARAFVVESFSVTQEIPARHETTERLAKQPWRTNWYHYRVLFAQSSSGSEKMDSPYG